MKRWLVDAHNFLHTNSDLVGKYKTNRKEVLEQVIMMVEEACQFKGRKAEIIFDGHSFPLAVQTQHCRWRFSGDQSADDMIIKKVSQSGVQKKWIVVSNDQDLKKRARNLGVSASSLGALAITSKTKSGKITQNESGSERDPVVTDNEILLMTLSLKSRLK